MVAVGVVGAVISTGNTDGRHILELVGLSAHHCTVDTLAGIRPGSVGESVSVGEETWGSVKLGTIVLKSIAWSEATCVGTASGPAAQEPRVS